MQRQGPRSIKQQKLNLAAHNLSSAMALFENPDLKLGLSYKDLLTTVGHYPELVRALLNDNVQGLENIEGIDKEQSILKLMDGHDLTLLGSQYEQVMRFIVDNYAEHLNGADLVRAATLYPTLAGRIFTDSTMLTKLNGRQLAELGALDETIARTIKDTPELWEQITVNHDVDKLAEEYNRQYEAGEIDELTKVVKIRGLESEEKTYLHVGILCKNHPKLAQELVDEGLLKKLNGEDLSCFAQHHPDIIEKIFDSPELLRQLEGHDYLRLGLASEKAARAILESPELLEDSGPHVWSQLAAKHPFFFKQFMGTFDASVRLYLDEMKKHETRPGYPKPQKNTLMRLTGEFLIELIQKKGPKFAEYIYEQAVDQKNPVYRYVLELDGPNNLLNVDAMLESMIREALESGKKVDEGFQMQLAVIAIGMEARNEQLAQRSDIFMSTLIGLSSKLGLRRLDELLAHPKELASLDGGHITAMVGKHPKVALKVLNSPMLCDKLSSGHLAQLAGLHPHLLARIWQTPALKDKLIEHFAVPRVAGKSLSILMETARNRGFLDQIFAASKQEAKEETQSDEVSAEVTANEGMPDDVPQGYVWYLYNILYPRAEVVKTLKSVMKQHLEESKEAQDLIEDKPQLVGSAYEVHQQSQFASSSPEASLTARDIIAATFERLSRQA